MPAGKYRERAATRLLYRCKFSCQRGMQIFERLHGRATKRGFPAATEFRARGKRKRWGRVKLFVNFRFAPRLRDPPPPSIRRHYFAFQPRFAIVVKRFLASSKRSVLRRSRCVIVIDDVTRDRARALSLREKEREKCVCVCVRLPSSP